MSTDLITSAAAAEKGMTPADVRTVAGQAAAKGLKGSFGVILTWPDLKNAEYENVMRMAATAKECGYQMIVLDNEGYPVGHFNGDSGGAMKRLEADDLDFIISLHFDSPRLYDCYSYSALWNPLQFYFDWGYDKSAASLISHSDFLSCGSALADGHVLGLMNSMKRRPQPFVEMFHSLSEPIRQPRLLDKPKLFYCGINWERINNTKGRHHDLLVKLDGTGYLNIFGPELFHGVRPWEGFKSYVGSIPFDGSSAIDYISECGVSLVFSSAAHQASGIMSNRLFESLAAGAVIIANPHPIIDKHFNGLVLTVDDSADSDSVFAQVMRHMRWIESNPEQAQAMASKAQALFRERFSLDKSFRTLYETHADRVEHFRRVNYATDAQTTVDVIVPFASISLTLWAEMIASLKRQKHVALHPIIVLDETFYRQNRHRIDADIMGLGHSTTLLATTWFSYSQDWALPPRRVKNTGEVIAKLKSALKSEFFTVMSLCDLWFQDHLTMLVRSLEDDGQALVATSGVLIEGIGADGRRSRRLDHLGQLDPENFIFANQDRYSGKFLYRRKVMDLVPETTLVTLDCQEHNLFNMYAYVNGAVTQTFYASYVYRENHEHLLPKPMTPVVYQHQMIRDTLAYDRRWMDQRAELLRPRRMAFATNTGATIRPQGIRQPGGDASLYRLGSRISFGKGGNGALYQQLGFSSPEAGWCWIEGTVAELVFDIAKPSDDLDLTISCAGVPTSDQRPQRMQVILNGVVVGFASAGAKQTEVTFCVQRELFGDNGKALLRLVMDHASEIQDASGKIADARKLSLQLFSIVLDKADIATVTDHETGEERTRRQFDERAYMEAHSDVAISVNAGGFASAWHHYVQFGKAEGRRAFWK